MAHTYRITTKLDVPANGKAGCFDAMDRLRALLHDLAATASHLTDAERETLRSVTFHGAEEFGALAPEPAAEEGTVTRRLKHGSLTLERVVFLRSRAPGDLPTVEHRWNLRDTTGALIRTGERTLREARTAASAHEDERRAEAGADFDRARRERRAREKRS